MDSEQDDDFPVVYASNTNGRNGSASQNRSQAQPTSDVIYDEQVASQLDSLDVEIASLTSQIDELQRLRSRLTRERKQVYQSYLDQTAASTTAGGSKPKNQGTDYSTSAFSWSEELLQTAKQVFGIHAFRMCQEAVCNAAMDHRDAVVVMPTGGGKSLCYQLPAIMRPGVTLVVSPLISLMTDQVFHLREVGIECELLSGSVSREETSDILRRVRTGTAAASSPSSRKLPTVAATTTKMSATGETDGIKLLYVTPERISKSKTCLSALQKAYEQGRLSRIVIDEAHCCSQMGHDYRPDYTKLSILRKLFPEVPIMCLTATCGPKVLKEVLEIVGLPPITEPANAAPRRTIYFTAPLYRKNLKYSVVQRPQNANESMEAIRDWILQNHRGKCGIVYCLSKKDTHSMATSLSDLSNGAIRTSVYHADLDDADKQAVHVDWRRGRISVVCATIAFGMGIDKPDVRFVLHACISKSLDGYYQETGRAGRDGKPSDCVLFYRPQDASRVSGLVAGEPTGQEKLHAMLSYSQSADCRKLLFARYFKDAFGDQERCGSCDNCLNPPSVVDVSPNLASAYRATTQARTLLTILTSIHAHGGRVTPALLLSLSMGQKSGRFPLSTGSSSTVAGGGVRTSQLDLAALGVTPLPSRERDMLERLVVEMMLRGYVEDEYHATAYTVNVYVRPGRLKGALGREGVKVQVAGGRAAGGATATGKRKAGKSSGARSGGKKGGAGETEEGHEDDDDDDDHGSGDGDGDGSDEEGQDAVPLNELRRRRKAAASSTTAGAKRTKTAGYSTGTSSREAIELDSD